MKKLFAPLLALTLSVLALIYPQQQVQANDVLESVMGGLGVSLMGCDIATKTNIDVFKTMSDTSQSYSLEKWIKKCEGSSQGAFTTAKTLIASTISNPPASAGFYVADLIENTGLAPQAYAQGVGFSSLTPILPLWKAFRNMTYFLFVIIFVVIGFAIMFRAQLNPQTVVSIQSALPNLVITLLLITFSYAIAGLLIDIMYVSIYLIIAMFRLGGIEESSPGALEQMAFNDGVVKNMFGFITGVGVGAATSVGGVINDVIGVWGVGEALGVIGGVLTFLIIAVAIIIGMFRTWFALIGAYVQIILAVITAPFQIMLNALPGSNSFQNWLRNLIANIAVFPAVIGMIYLTYFLFWNTSYETGFKAPQLADGFSGAATGLIGIGVIMLMPDIVKIVKGALQVKESELGQAASNNFNSGNFIAGGLGYGLGMAKSGVSQVGGTAFAGWAGKSISGRINSWRQGSRANEQSQEVDRLGQLERDWDQDHKPKTSSMDSKSPTSNVPGKFRRR